MNQAPTTRRRWYQFGLGTFLIIVALLAIFFTYQRNRIQERREFLNEERQKALDLHAAFIEQQSWRTRGGRTAASSPSAPGFFWLFGESGLDIAWVVIDGRGLIPTDNGHALKQKLTDVDLDRLRKAKWLFPEAEVGITAIEPLADGTVHAWGCPIPIN